MQNLLSDYISKFKKEHFRRNQMNCILLALAAVVVLGVYWSLKLTGAAQVNEVYCGLEEHVHDDSCYEAVLVCGYEEGEEIFISDDNTSGEAVSAETHVHTDDCYEKVLTCGLEEHTHTVECMSDSGADTETSADWEADLPSLTGVWADDVVTLAESQLGYTESTDNFITDDDGETRRGYTIYGAWYGNEYGVWDAMFVSFCLYYAGVPDTSFPYASGAYAWTVSLTEEGLYADAEEYIPSAGDLVFFNTEGDGRADTVGIITEVNEDENTITVIEGDFSDTVAKNTYSLDDSSIVGYGVLPSQTSEDETEETSETAAEADGGTESGAAAVAELISYTAEEVQALIDALPSVEEVSAMDIITSAQAYTQIETASAAYESLSEEDKALVDSSLLDELLEYYGGLNFVEENMIMLLSTANSGTESLEDYIASVNAQSGQSASITLTLRTESDSDISGTTVTTNTTYHLALTAYSSVGFEANTTYTYTLPDGISAEAGSGIITVKDDNDKDVEIGTWTVSDDGTVTYTFNEKASDYQDVEITFTSKVAITTTEETITIGETTYTVSQNTNLAVNKSGNYSGFTKTDYYYGRTYEIEFSQSGVSLAGTKVTDYATDTQYSPLYTGGTISYENQHFDTSTPLVITIVDANGATVYTWTVDWSDSNLTLYTLDEDDNVVETTSTSDRIIGWQYTFPDTVTYTDSGGNPVTVDLTTADWSPYEIHITGKTIFDVVPSADNTRPTYHNWVEVDNGVEQDTAHTSISQSTGTYSLRKDWSRCEDGVSVDWKVTATIPGGTVASYELSDNMYVDKMTTENYQVFSDSTTNRTMTITISEGTTINGTEIEAGTYTVYDISGEVPEDALFVYNCVLSPSGFTAYFVLGMVCHCDKDYCDGWEDGSGCKNILYTSTNGTTYCTCWQLDQSAKIELTYTTPKDKMLELLSKYGYDVKKLYNYADLRKGTYNDARSLTSTSVLSAYTANVGLALAAKTLKKAPTSENDYTASYEIVINTNHLKLTENGEDLTITDTLSSSMTFLSSELVILATDTSGNVSKLTSDDYTYSYDSDTHVITITIKNPGTNSYTITYDAQILNPTSTTTYSNSFTLSWQGEDVTVTTDTASLSEVTTSGTSYTVIIMKTDKTTGAALPNAEFTLYNANEEEMATGTTDENGTVTFKTTSGTSGTLTFSDHTLYYLVETDTPDGYETDDTKHYFYFCNSDEDPCSACSSMTLPTGTTVLKNYGGTVSITNEPATYDFTIKKVKASDENITLSGAEFYLYYESAVLDSEGKETGEMHQYYAVIDSTDGTITWNSSTDQATKIAVDDNGTVTVSGLPAGTYYLKEITAPAGYNLLSDPIKIAVASDGTFTINDGIANDNYKFDDNSNTLTVSNTSGTELPSAGSSGRLVCHLTGLLLFCSYSLLLLYKRRRAGRNPL